jgi:hypothetical protein
MKISIVMAILFLATGAFGATINFTILPANTENNTYNGFSGGTIDGLPFTNLICDDYLNTTYFPSGPLSYNISTLDTLTYARFGANHDDAVHKYEEAAILINGLQLNPALTADYQYALWTLFTPSVPDFKTSGTLLGDVNSIADFSPYTSLFSELVVYTPAEGFQTNQEFLQLQPGPKLSGTPEPGSMVLLGIGVGLMGVWFICVRTPSGDLKSRRNGPAAIFADLYKKRDPGAIIRET